MTTTEYWFYAGRRENKSGRLVDCWKDGNGNLYLFAPFKGAGRRVIGGLYKVEVDRAAATLAIHGNPRPERDKLASDRRPSQDEINKWITEDATAEVEVEVRRREKKLSERCETIGRMTLNDVRFQMSRLLPAQRRAMLAAVLNYIQ